jgi:hypothetical protein
MNFFAGLLLLLMPEENAFWYGPRQFIASHVIVGSNNLLNPSLVYVTGHWLELSMTILMVTFLKK